MRFVKRIVTDESGAVLLLTGMMAFFIAVLFLITMDAGLAICRRIQAQNAVDAAADAAALWQARGCNLLQHLNNVHYNANVAFTVAETMALMHCVGGIDYAFDCVECMLAPYIDRDQEVFSSAVISMQKDIARVFPLLAMAQANAAAKANGADQLAGTVAGYLEKAGKALGLSFLQGKIVNEKIIPGGIYAAPLDEKSLRLYVEPMVAKKGKMPWYFSKWFADQAARVGMIKCPGFNYELPNEWGWHDSYYRGNPGFMTWIAGKKRHDELLGRGDWIWFNGRKNTHGDVLYNGPSHDNSRPINLPDVIALASSQVEGLPVVAHGKANAQARLITVQIPSAAKPIKGERFLIMH